MEWKLQEIRSARKQAFTEVERYLTIQKKRLEENLKNYQMAVREEILNPQLGNDVSSHYEEGMKHIEEGIRRYEDALDLHGDNLQFLKLFGGDLHESYKDKHPLRASTELLQNPYPGRDTAHHVIPVADHSIINKIEPGVSHLDIKHFVAAVEEWTGDLEWRNWQAAMGRDQYVRLAMVVEANVLYYDQPLYHREKDRS